ncbi:MAG: hypothetical protein EPN20_00075, partial [Magnetospirillum sp.]
MDKGLRKLTGDFTSVGDRMRADVPMKSFTAVFDYLTKKKVVFEAVNDLELARHVTDHELPLAEKTSQIAGMVSGKKDKARPGREAEKTDRIEGFISKDKTSAKVLTPRLQGSRAGFHPGGSLAPRARQAPEGDIQAFTRPRKEPFAAQIQFSGGRDVTLRLDENGLNVLSGSARPGLRDGDARLVRVLDVPDEVRDADVARIPVERFRDGNVHRYGQLRFSTGHSSANDFWAEGLPAHDAYDHWRAQREVAAPGMEASGWQARDVPLASAVSGDMVRFPGFVSATAPGLAVVPFPAYGATEEDTDRNAVRWRLLHLPSGNLMGAYTRLDNGQLMAPLLYTASGAAQAAEKLSAAADWAQIDPRSLPPLERKRLGDDMAQAFARVRDSDHAAWVAQESAGYDAAELSRRGFNQRVFWITVDDATRPELGLEPRPYYAYEDKDLAQDMGDGNAIPVRLRLNDALDMTSDYLPQKAQDTLRDFFAENEESLKFGLGANLYDQFSYDSLSDGEEDSVEARVEAELA